MIMIKPNNSRWYYFLSREQIMLYLPDIEIINTDLAISKDKQSLYNMGLLYNLMSISENKKEASNILNNIYRTLPRYIGGDLL